MSMSSATSGAGIEQARSLRNMLGAPTRDLGLVHLIFEIVSVLSEHARIGCCVAPIASEHVWQVLVPSCETIHTVFNQESRFGRRRERESYNHAMLAKVGRTRRTEIGQFGGLHDLFVPIVIGRRCDAALVAGPFLMNEPTPSWIVREWSALRGNAPDRTDPELATYVRAMLGLSRFEGNDLAALKELLAVLAKAVTGRPPRSAARIDRLRSEVFGPLVSSRQSKASRMLDPSHNGSRHKGVLSEDEIDELGIREIPNSVVAVMPAWADARERDAVTALVESYTFQRRAAELAARFEGTLGAPLEDYGAYFLFRTPDGTNPARRHLFVADRARAIANLLERELGFAIIAGAGSIAGHAEELPRSAKRAARMLQLAANRGTSVLVYDESTDLTGSAQSRGPATVALELLELVTVGTGPELAAKQDEYVSAVHSESIGRVGRIRMHFAYVIEALVDKLTAARQLDARTAFALRERLSESLEHSTSGTDLIRAFHDAMGLLARTSALSDRSPLELKLGLAARHIEEQCHRPLSLAAVAHHVGLSKNHFCERFKVAFGTGFADYLRRARIARAKRMLRVSRLSVQKVARESGFVAPAHFHRAFKEIVGVTPSQYRRHHAGSAD